MRHNIYVVFEVSFYGKDLGDIEVLQDALLHAALALYPGEHKDVEVDMILSADTKNK